MFSNLFVLKIRKNIAICLKKVKLNSIISRQILNPYPDRFKLSTKDQTHFN